MVELEEEFVATQKEIALIFLFFLILKEAEDWVGVWGGGVLILELQNCWIREEFGLEGTLKWAEVGMWGFQKLQVVSLPAEQGEKGQSSPMPVLGWSWQS